MKRLLPLVLVLCISAPLRAEEETPDLSQLDAEQLRAVAKQLYVANADLQRQIVKLKAENAKLMAAAQTTAAPATAPAPQAGADPFVDARKARGIELAAEITKLKARIAKGERAPNIAGVLGPKELLKFAEAELVDVKNGSWAPPLATNRKLAVGNRGRFKDSYKLPPLPGGNFYLDPFIDEIEVVQVIDENNAIIRAYDQDVWLEGVDTTKWADGNRYALPGFFEIPRTRQFATVAGGTSTVFVVVPIGGVIPQPGTPGTSPGAPSGTP